MHIGMQLFAPNGFHSLSKSTRYYLAERRVEDGAALLVWFEGGRERQRRVRFIRLGRLEFERALLEDPPALVPADKQRELPEWLQEFEGLNLDEIEEFRYKGKQETYRQQVERTLSHISLALKNKREILSSDDPLKELSRYAYSGGRNLHPHRIQVWFFSFILHGENVWALKRGSKGTGKWDRSDEKHASQKFGRPSLTDGSMYGWSLAQIDQENIVDSYLAYCGLGVTMAEIYRRALTESFGCRAQEQSESGRLRLYHSENKPFPSYGQFRYVIVKEFGLTQVQTTVLGAPRMRSNAKHNEGNFTRPYANVLESLVVDAYHVSDRARAYRSNNPMPALIAARGICETTAGVVGIGFSLGAESGEAYRSMLFCMAISKAEFARLIGIPPEHLNWIMEGLPPSFTSDRGPAAAKDLVDHLIVSFPIKTIIPSHSGQSNAVVEASHPKSVGLEGAPTYQQSDLDLVKLIKREVYRACRDNHTKDISDRLSDEAVMEFRQRGWPATPHYYWKYLQERLRTSGHSISMEQAVRAFCTPVQFDVDCDGVRYRSHWFNSGRFKKTGIQDEAANVANFKLRGYVLSLAMRYVWVEVKGELIEVEACSRVRVDGADLYIPLSEMERFAEERKALKSATRESAVAADVDARAKFEQANGQSWNSGHRRTGSPKRAKGVTTQEAKSVNGKFGEKRRA